MITAHPGGMGGQVIQVPGGIDTSVMESRSSEATGVLAAVAVETEAKASVEDSAVMAAQVLLDSGESWVRRALRAHPQMAAEGAGAVPEALALPEVSVERVVPDVPAHPVVPGAEPC